MLRTLSASALALAIGGAAMAQQAPDTTDASTEAAAAPRAPASAGTGLKGVYSSKRLMGISTGQAGDDTDASGEDVVAGEADEDDASAKQ